MRMRLGYTREFASACRGGRVGTSKDVSEGKEASRWLVLDSSQRGVSRASEWSMGPPRKIRGEVGRWIPVAVADRWIPDRRSGGGGLRGPPDKPGTYRYKV